MRKGKRLDVADDVHAHRPKRKAGVLCALLAWAGLRELVKPGPLARAAATQGIILTVPG
jgi:hypothetical protein